MVWSLDVVECKRYHCIDGSNATNHEPRGKEMTRDEALANIQAALEGNRRALAIRTSSAQARGAAKQYSYWGTALYRIYWSEHSNWPVAYCTSRACSERRSYELAKKDTLEQAEAEKRFVLDNRRFPGKLSEKEILDLAVGIQTGSIRII